MYKAACVTLEVPAHVRFRMSLFYNLHCFQLVASVAEQWRQLHQMENFRPLFVPAAEKTERRKKVCPDRRVSIVYCVFVHCQRDHSVYPYVTCIKLD